MGGGVSVGSGVRVGQGVSVGAGVAVGQGVSAPHGVRVGHWLGCELTVWLGEGDGELDGVETLEPAQAPTMAVIRSIAAASRALLRRPADICRPGLPDSLQDFDRKLENIPHLPGGPT